ncbi:MAG: NADH-quinone oxidoreductase subunit C [Betaproteobacteria bacterium]|nr:NADH-quinone oxidoreductase subunit C [Betaproteobacteria bacterium]
MDLLGLGLEASVLTGACHLRRCRVDAEDLVTVALGVREEHGRLVALWGSDERDRENCFHLHLAFEDAQGLLVLDLPLAEEMPSYPDLSEIFPAATRMQRAAYDLFGFWAIGPDQRFWVRHAAWPDTEFPLRRDFDGSRQWPAEPEEYPFVRVAGEGVHEIPVGPVHAGIIEPGHFRFQVVGEKVLRLEQRLGYVHKGIEKRFEELPAHSAHRLAGRISGDTTVAWAWAWAMAYEQAAEIQPPVRALWLRGVLLELERVANHLGDLGYLGNDGGFAFGLAQFSRLKEVVLRANQAAFGHRLLMDRIIPGGVSTDLTPAARATLREFLPGLAAELGELRTIFDDHAGLQDRFMSTGRVTPELAASLGLSGLAGRASGQARDLRVDYPATPYDRVEVRRCGGVAGDVAARVALRFDEIFESLRLLHRFLGELPEGEWRTEAPPPPAGAHGFGWVEAWRGPVFLALEAGPDGGLRRVHAHDPSWENWPVLEHAVMGNIVPDFPLINKSFNLSYSGQDL